MVIATASPPYRRNEALVGGVQFLPCGQERPTVRLIDPLRQCLSAEYPRDVGVEFLECPRRRSRYEVLFRRTGFLVPGDDLLNLRVAQIFAGLGAFQDFGTSRLRNAIRSDKVKDAAR